MLYGYTGGELPIPERKCWFGKIDSNGSFLRLASSAIAHYLDGLSKVALAAPTALLYALNTGQKTILDIGEMLLSFTWPSPRATKEVSGRAVIMRKIKKLRERTNTMPRRSILEAEVGLSPVLR